ncbi:MAG: Uncharacterised protein [Crocinitomicaceae bacterium]|nr:MAG: Uncharacterised protein [Crocinitomicaceae bacterium]
MLLVLFPTVNFGQKIGDSICFKTIYNSVYHGTIEKIDSDGYFFKSNKDRVLYLKNSEINSFQTFPYSLNKEKKTNSSLKNLEYNVPKKISNVVKELENNLIDVNKLSSKIGKNVIIFLKDGRELKGEIIKVTYKIDVFGVQQEVIKFLNSNKKMNVLTTEIEKVQEIK